MPEVANHGYVRPPVVYLSAVGVALLLHWLWPQQVLPASANTPIGMALALFACALFISSMLTFRKAGTPVPGNRPTTVIVRTGPYRFSRNPIYLAFSLLQLGIASWVNSAWLIGTLAAAVAVMSFVVIPREEHYLERKFGASYLDYKRSVRRWF